MLNDMAYQSERDQTLPLDESRSLIDGVSSARGEGVEDLAAVTRAIPAPMK